MRDRPRILLINGSRRRLSYTRTLLEQLATLLQERGAACTMVDPGIQPLGIYDPDYHHRPDENPEEHARMLSSAARAADGLVLATPVYHNSYSGILKNIIDHLTIEQLRYKPVALLSHGGNRATHAVDHLRIVVRGLIGIALPAHVCTSEQDFRTMGDTGLEVSSPEILARLERAAAELVTFARLLQPLRETIARG